MITTTSTRALPTYPQHEYTNNSITVYNVFIYIITSTRIKDPCAVGHRLHHGRHLQTERAWGCLNRTLSCARLRVMTREMLSSPAQLPMSLITSSTPSPHPHPSPSPSPHTSPSPSPSHQPVTRPTAIWSNSANVMAGKAACQQTQNQVAAGAV